MTVQTVPISFVLFGILPGILAHRYPAARLHGLSSGSATAPPLALMVTGRKWREMVVLRGSFGLHRGPGAPGVALWVIRVMQ